MQRAAFQLQLEQLKRDDAKLAAEGAPSGSRHEIKGKDGVLDEVYNKFKTKDKDVKILSDTLQTLASEMRKNSQVMDDL